MLAGIILLGYFWIVLNNTDNIPKWDDYETFLKFVCDFEEQSTVIEQFKLLVSLWSEHRMLFIRLVTLANYTLTGQINLIVFIVITNLMLIGILAMFYAFLKNKKRVALFMTFAILLILNGQNFETSTWAMGGFQNVAISLLAMISIYALFNHAKYGFMLGLALASFTIFSNGNGMGLLPAVGLSLALQKEFKKLTWFVAIAGIAVVIYFVDLELSSRSNAEFLQRIPAVTMAFFCFLGGNLWLPSAKILALAWGAIVVTTYLWAIKSNLYKNNIEWFTFFSFIMVTASQVAINRPLEEIAPLRYRIHCCMATVLTVMFYAENWEMLKLPIKLKLLTPPRNLLKISTIVAVTLFNILCSILYLNKCEKYTQAKKVSAYNWQRDKSGLIPNYTNREMDKILANAENKGVYFMPKLTLQQLETNVTTNMFAQTPQQDIINFHFDYVDCFDQYVVVKGYAYTTGKSMDFTNICLTLVHNQQNLLVETLAERRYDLNLNTSIQENCGFFAVIPKTKLISKNYTIGITIQKNYGINIGKSTSYIITEQTIEL
jgi:hypothetical protein